MDKKMDSDLPDSGRTADRLVETVNDVATSSISTVLEPQIVLILIGLPGSAKSTFSNALVEASQTPEWISSSPSSDTTSGSVSDSAPESKPIRRRWTRISQDEAPSRRRQECERQLVDSLRRGENVVVDRVNFDPSQRSHFISLSESFHPRPKIYALTLQVSPQTLQYRLTSRSGHPTIPDAETGLRVLGQMTATFDPPRADRPEGFDRVYVLPEDRQPLGGKWGVEEVLGVLKDIEGMGERERGERLGGFGRNATGRGRGGRGVFEARGGGRGRGNGGYGGHGGHGGYSGHGGYGMNGHEAARGRGGYGGYGYNQPGYGGRGAYGGNGGNYGQGGQGGQSGPSGRGTYGGHDGPVGHIPYAPYAQPQRGGYHHQQQTGVEPYRPAPRSTNNDAPQLGTSAPEPGYALPPPATLRAYSPGASYQSDTAPR